MPEAGKRSLLCRQRSLALLSSFRNRNIRSQLILGSVLKYVNGRRRGNESDPIFRPAAAMTTKPCVASVAGHSHTPGQSDQISNSKYSEMQVRNRTSFK